VAGRDFEFSAVTAAAARWWRNDHSSVRGVKSDRVGRAMARQLQMGIHSRRQRRHELKSRRQRRRHPSELDPRQTLWVGGGCRRLRVRRSDGGSVSLTMLTEQRINGEFALGTREVRYDKDQPRSVKLAVVDMSTRAHEARHVRRSQRRNGKDLFSLHCFCPGRNHSVR
jgi:hypothetical protein